MCPSAFEKCREAVNLLNIAQNPSFYHPFLRIFTYNNLLSLEMSSKDLEQSDDYLHQPQAKAKYTKTSMKKKTRLIELVVNGNYSIYKASKKLKLSNSTAKSILRNYQKYGTILEKFTKNRILKLQTSSEPQSKEHEPSGNIKEEESQEREVIKQQVENNPQIQCENQYYPFFTYPYLFYTQMPAFDHL